MTQTNEQTVQNSGFAIPLLPDTDLGMAMLIAESEDGQHEPVAIVRTISEAQDVADSDFRDRMRCVEQGEDAILCPFIYQVWARGIGGHYRIAYKIADLK